MIAGRCSHICNAGFLTTAAARGKGVGQQMGEAYLEFAPKLVCISPCMKFEFPLVNTDLCSVGIQILRLQPGLREQPGFDPYLGEARVQCHRTGSQGGASC